MLNLLKTASRPCWLVGHRGAMGHAPENTMASFVCGWKMGADLVECDVHISKDGKCVVMHDEALERTTNQEGLIRDLSVSQIKKADAGAWLSKKFKGEKVPLLSELLDWARDEYSAQELPMGVVIELKNEPVRYADFEKKVIAEVLAARMEDRVILISFDHGVIRRAKAHHAGVAAGILYNRPLEDPIRRAQDMNADAIFPRRNFVTKKLVERAHRANLAVGTWTVNEEPEMRKIVACGADAIATNYPDLLNRVLEKSR